MFNIIMRMFNDQLPEYRSPKEIQNNGKQGVASDAWEENEEALACRIHQLIIMDTPVENIRKIIAYDDQVRKRAKEFLPIVLSEVIKPLALTTLVMEYIGREKAVNVKVLFLQGYQRIYNGQPKNALSLLCSVCFFKMSENMKEIAQLLVNNQVWIEKDVEQLTKMIEKDPRRKYSEFYFSVTSAGKQNPIDLIKQVIIPYFKRQLPQIVGEQENQFGRFFKKIKH